MKRYILLVVISWSIGLLARDTIQPLVLSLQQCREMVLAHSEDLQQATNKAQQAKYDNRVATQGFLPKVDGTGMGMMMFPNMDMMGMEVQMKGAYMAGITLTQPLYAGGKIVHGKKMAKMGMAIADEQARMARMDAIVDADNGYWTYIAVLRKVQMLEAYCMQMDTLEQQVQASVDVGMATDNDILHVQAEAGNLKYQLQRATNGAELCRMSLCQLLGVEAQTVVIPTDTVIFTEDLPQFNGDIEGRPELFLLRKAVDVEKQQVKMTKADMIPNIGLSVGFTAFGNIKMKSMVDDGAGGYVPYTMKIEDQIGIAMLAVSIPISNWWETGTKVKKEKLELHNTELDLQKNERLLSIEVQQAIRNVQDGYLLIQTATQALAQANENLRVTTNRYNAHMATLTDQLDAQSQWQQASSNLIEAQTQYKIYLTAYERATGVLE